MSLTRDAFFCCRCFNVCCDSNCFVGYCIVKDISSIGCLIDDSCEVVGDEPG